PALPCPHLACTFRLFAILNLSSTCLCSVKHLNSKPPSRQPPDLAPIPAHIPPSSSPGPPPVLLTDAAVARPREGGSSQVWTLHLMHNLILLARPAIRQSISPSTHDTHPDRPRRDAAAAGATPTTTLPSGIHLRLVILSLDWTGSVPSLPHLQCIYLQSPRRRTSTPSSICQTTRSSAPPSLLLCHTPGHSTAPLIINTNRPKYASHSLRSQCRRSTDTTSSIPARPPPTAPPTSPCSIPCCPCFPARHPLPSTHLPIPPCSVPVLKRGGRFPQANRKPRIPPARPPMDRHPATYRDARTCPMSPRALLSFYAANALPAMPFPAAHQSAPPLTLPDLRPRYQSPSLPAPY
ncbi:hypothetical protein GQ607_003778, partial [Colletotrichum asianum]